jgi:hypothetical protein
VLKETVEKDKAELVVRREYSAGLQQRTERLVITPEGWRLSW